MLIKLFRRKPPPPLKEALRYVQQASEIVMQHKRDKGFTPTQSDLVLLGYIEKAFHEGHGAASYVTRCLHQRFDGQPEGSAKWHNEEVFNYHYPE